MQNFYDFFNTLHYRVAIAKRDMLTLDFAENYNGKLFTDHFNDVRLYSMEYIKGTQAEIKLLGVSMGIIQIEAVRTLPFSRLTEVVSYLNLGKSVQHQAEYLKREHNEGRPISPETIVSHLVCGYVDRNITNQTLLINEWWNSKKQSA